ncbi:hypothetical protein Ciccas_006309 [Cichlidogyrus casuarinus]|uniref:Uncharacterized protein n=1 Tax=Cichlidogyrus casuarinus TaxID=1844966 RepID=A0ABD2Q6M3_9PLAT
MNATHSPVTNATPVSNGASSAFVLATGADGTQKTFIIPSNNSTAVNPYATMHASLMLQQQTSASTLPRNLAAAATSNTAVYKLVQTPTGQQALVAVTNTNAQNQQLATAAKPIVLNSQFLCLFKLRHSIFWDSIWA